MNIKIYISVLYVFLIILFVSCHKDSSLITKENNNDSKQIKSAKIVLPGKKIPSFGDLWLSTWAADDNLYMSWGDGIGPGTHYPVPAGVPVLDTALVVSSCEDSSAAVIVFCDNFCEVYNCDGVTPYSPRVITQAGLFKLSGPVDAFQGCDGNDCIQGIHIPTGKPQFKFGTDPTKRRGDKPSSLVAYNGIIYWFGHQLMAEPKYGYLAFSNNGGKSWTEIPNSPWGANSNFRVMMVINMGRNFSLSKDGFVYLLGINGELNWPPSPQKVYLARIGINEITDYQSYRYFKGLNGEGKPIWSVEQDSAVALENLNTISLGSAIYHPGVEKFIFLAVPNYPEGPALTLFYADNPWGPWMLAQKFDGEVYIPGIIPKDTGKNSFYFTAAGGGGVGDTYQLTIAKIEMMLE